MATIILIPSFETITDEWHRTHYVGILREVDPHNFDTPDGRVIWRAPVAVANLETACRHAAEHIELLRYTQRHQLQLALPT